MNTSSLRSVPQGTGLTAARNHAIFIGLVTGLLHLRERIKMLYPNLRIALQTRRLTQRNLALVLRLSPQALSDKLNGIGELAPHQWQRLAECLGFEASWLAEQVSIPARAGYRPREFEVLPRLALETRG